MCARPCLPVLLRAERGAAAPVAVDLLHSGADIIVAHVQHVEAGCRGGQQGRAVQQGQTALCQSRLHTHGCKCKKLNDGGERGFIIKCV